MNETNANKKSPPKIPRERPIYMSRSSDVIGSSYKTDNESHMKLIVSKITQRCGTVAELMYLTIIDNIF